MYKIQSHFINYVALFEITESILEHTRKKILICSYYFNDILMNHYTKSLENLGKIKS